MFGSAIASCREVRATVIASAGRPSQSVADAVARREGFGLLTLDAKSGDAAETLLGGTHAGTIPGFAFDPDGMAAHEAVPSVAVRSKDFSRPEHEVPR